MDASVLKPGTPSKEQSPPSLCSISGWFLMHAGSPIAWGCACHHDTTQSSCQAEVYSINETTKLILEFWLFFCNLYLPLTSPFEIKNNNQGAFQWSKGTTTKKMRWVDLCENLVRENISNHNITVSHIPDKSNLSDIFTKEFRNVSQYFFLRDLFMASSVEFTTAIVPTDARWRVSYKSALINKST